jgi:hypothetical protein
MENDHAVEQLRHSWIWQHPDYSRIAAVPLCFLQYIAHNLVLRALVQRRQGPIENNEIGAFQQRAGQIQLLALRAGQASAAYADIEF